MARECVRHEPLAKIALHSPEFYKFFDYVEMSTFDVASDAFSTFKVCVLFSIEKKQKKNS
jgi:calcium binding protein 39